MKKNIWILLIAITLLATVLRFWQLGSVPLAPDWDEVSLGYNAYSILHTGKDEYGTFLPIVLRSFGDYKPALYSYLAIPTIALLDLSVFAVRFPSALFGVLSVFVTFFLVKELFKRNDLALLSSFLLAVSPWHIQFSRVAFESNIGLSLNMIGAFLFLKALRKPFLLIPSVGIFALTIYAYQSEKIFTPLVVFLLCIVFMKELKKMPKKILLASVLLGMFIILPMVSFTLLNKNGLARAQGVSIFSSNAPTYSINQTRYTFNKSHNDIVGLFIDNGRLLYAKTFLANYLSHFNLNWLFIMGDISRHHAPDMGLLYLWELPFIAIGIFQLLFGSYQLKTKLVVFGWLLLAPLPASFTIDTPHAVRTLTMLPVWQILSSVGILSFFLKSKRKKWKKIPYGYVAVGLVGIVALFNFLYYIDQYFVQLNYVNALDWQYGYEQIVPDTVSLGKSYQHIVVSNERQFGQSYIFYLFYMKYDPYLYQKQERLTDSGVRSFGKYTFQPIHWDNQEKLANTLFVGNISDFPAQLDATEKVYYTPSEEAFAEIVKR